MSTKVQDQVVRFRCIVISYREIAVYFQQRGEIVIIEMVVVQVVSLKYHLDKEILLIPKPFLSIQDRAIRKVMLLVMDFPMEYFMGCFVNQDFIQSTFIAFVVLHKLIIQLDHLLVCHAPNNLLILSLIQLEIA